MGDLVFMIPHVQFGIGDNSLGCVRQTLGDCVQDDDRLRPAVDPRVAGDSDAEANDSSGVYGK